MADRNYITFSTIDNTVKANFKVVRRNETIVKGGRPRRTLAGLDFVMGKPYRVIEMTIKVRAEDQQWGTRQDLEDFFALQDYIYFTDHDGRIYKAVLIGNMDVENVTMFLTGAEAVFYVRATIVLVEEV